MGFARWKRWHTKYLKKNRIYSDQEIWLLEELRKDRTVRYTRVETRCAVLQSPTCVGMSESEFIVDARFSRMLKNPMSTRAAKRELGESVKRFRKQGHDTSPIYSTILRLLKRRTHFVEYKEASFLMRVEARLQPVVDKQTYTEARNSDPWYSKVLPARPASRYAGKGWISWKHFTGRDKYMPYAAAQQFVQSNNIFSRQAYRAKRHRRLPSAPDVVYKNAGWISWHLFFFNEA